jgi:hypothetical protein
LAIRQGTGANGGENDGSRRGSFRTGRNNPETVKVAFFQVGKVRRTFFADISGLEKPAKLFSQEFPFRKKS